MIFDGLERSEASSKETSSTREVMLSETAADDDVAITDVQSPPPPIDEPKTVDKHKTDEWLCDKCGNVKEDNGKSFCLKCATWGGFGTIQGNGEVPFPEIFVQEETGTETPGWICGNCDHKNDVDATYCAQCATVHARAMHVKTVGNAAMAVLALDQVEVIDGKKEKTKLKMDGHTGEVSTALKLRQQTDGNTGSVTTKVTLNGVRTTTQLHNGPDKKNEGKWTCEKCQAKNFDAVPYCQGCATVRNKPAGKLR